MNLVNVVQQYNKLLILDDFIKYKYDSRTKRKYQIKSKSLTNNNNIQPIINLEHITSNINDTIAILNQHSFIKPKQFSKPPNISINNNNNNNNNNDNDKKENEEGIVTTTEALEHPLLNRPKPSEIKPPKYIIKSKPSAKKRCLSSISSQQSKIGFNNNNNNNKRFYQNYSCKNMTQTNKNISNENEQTLNQFPNPNLFHKKNILSKAVRYSVNNVPYVKVGIYGRVSNKEGIKVNVVPPFYNRKMKEELYEYNERIIPMLKVRKINELESDVNQIERYKIQECYRSGFNPQESYFVTKPYLPTLRGKLNRNALTAKKYNVVRGGCENGKIEIVDNSDC